MPDMGPFAFAILEQTIEKVFAKLADDLGVPVEEILDHVSMRESRSEDYDDMGVRDYNLVTVAGEQTTAASRHYLETNKSKPLAVLIAGLHVGTIDGNIDYVRVEINNTTVREWPGPAIHSNAVGPWIASDPVWAMGTEQVRWIISLIAADAVARYHPLIYFFMKKTS